MHAGGGGVFLLEGQDQGIIAKIKATSLSKEAGKRSDPKKEPEQVKQVWLEEPGEEWAVLENQEKDCGVKEASQEWGTESGGCLWRCLAAPSLPGSRKEMTSSSHSWKEKEQGKEPVKLVENGDEDAEQRLGRLLV